MSKQVNTADEQDEIQHMDYIYMVNDDKLMIRMNAELDHHLADEMRDVIDTIIEERGVRHLIFDFSKISFMDSSGIGLIMGRYKRVMFRGGKAAVTNVGKEIERNFNLSGLFQIIERYATPEQAVAGLNAKKDK